MEPQVYPSAADYQELLIDNQWQLVRAKGSLFDHRKVGGSIDNGRPLPHVLGPLWNRSVKRMCVEAFEQGVSSSHVIDKFYNGTNLALLLGCTPSIDQGRINGLKLKIQDVTAKRRLEHQNDLRDRMTMIAQLASHVGHKMNNPIATVLNKISGLLEENGDSLDVAHLRGEMKKIQEQLFGLSLITSGLAAFSKSSTKEFKLVQVNNVVQDALHLMKLVDSAHKIEFKTTLKDGLPRVLGSEVTLEQCLVNVCKNSVEAMPDGGKIHITTKIDEQFTDFITIKITDNGPGMKEEIQKHIFEPFYSTKTSHHGLGLCVSFAVASNHNGGLELWSQEDKGTTVQIILPIAKVELARGNRHEWQY